MEMETETTEGEKTRSRSNITIILIIWEVLRILRMLRVKCTNIWNTLPLARRSLKSIQILIGRLISLMGRNWIACPATLREGNGALLLRGEVL